MQNNRGRTRSGKHTELVVIHARLHPSVCLLGRRDAPGTARATDNLSKQVFKSFTTQCDSYTPETPTAAPHTPSSQGFTPTHHPGCPQQRPRRRAATYKPEQLPQLSLPPGASLSTVRFLPSTAGAAPCSSNSSASGDPHSHASPAIFATNTSLTQRAPRRAATSQTRHVRAASHPPPDVSAPHLT